MKKKIKSAARKLIDASKIASPFKAQKGQDRWVVSMLSFKRNGFFLDVGAADGVTHSNTYGLEKYFGWRGICLEANPIFYRTLKDKRRCICDNSVVSDKPEKVKFRVDNGQLGGIVAEDTDNNTRIRSGQLTDAEIIEMEAITLTRLLEIYEAPEIIDYLSMDIEGGEERAIRSLDFNKYKFKCITIERPTPKVNEILFNNGYLFVKNHKFDTFYVHSSLAAEKKIKRARFEQIPAKDW